MEKILDLSGFNPTLRADVAGYEIDVLLDYKTLRVAFECKQYEKSNLTVRNLIHEWDGKQREIGVDRVVLVLVGVNIGEDDYELAEKRDITIWDGEDVEELLDRALEGGENIKEEILTKASLESAGEIEEEIERISENYNVRKKIAEKYLRGELGDKEIERYSEINNSEGVLNSLDSRDKQRYAKENEYYGTEFTEVVKEMKEYEISDKNKARILVDDQGGTVDGESYASRDVKKIKLLADRSDLSGDECFGLFDRLKQREGLEDGLRGKGEKPKMKFLRRATKVTSVRSDLKFEDIEKLFDEGYTVTQLKKSKDKAQRKSHDVDNDNENHFQTRSKAPNGEQEEDDELKKNDASGGILSKLRAKLT